MLTFGAVRSAFDFDSPGKRSGAIELEHSDNRHAFSAVCVPVGVICGAPGPTVLLAAGNHGDEYEGQVILHRLMQMLEPENLTGRLILLPALNTPAVLDRARVSPLDQGNMNRSFPGSADAGPTQAIAGFVDAHLIPRADVILDFHSGGSATQYVDCGFLCIGPDAALNRANLELAKVFGAPFAMICPIDGAGGDFDTAAHQQQTRFLACELGGLGRFSKHSFEIGLQATLRVLAYLGLIEGEKGAPATRFIDIGDRSVHATARHHGLAQIHVRLGDAVTKGTHLATIYDLHNFGSVLNELYSDRSGIIAVCRRNPLVTPGDHLCLIAPEIPTGKVLDL
ncbi:succinylglutamate desuccinylase/aspartoacylase family protein [Roseovarius aestuarii]|uniref:Succinylglutamate desuccinylase / Aspartoacylase family protein n=1 Tax=Roseovarius aestuarii TaxID=475083 RepID=A0A1X7BNX2_9RHOB|nr:succinylglutamate desuccinylase/aspartoacylase family protein [Roseovarius aestuarii]SMC11291.1 Succinylglutamate desuccinylase / Aspartoacylase family protein [Roseovarius aestuarii]